VIAIRDTKDRTGPVLRFTAQTWQRFAQQVRRSLQRTPVTRDGGAWRIRARMSG
jgi:hypothetical protein